jgi:sarcosine oxidase
MTPRYDAVVVGLGGMGSAAAYHLAARGKRVLGLDQHPAAHDRGSSHGGSRIIRQAYHEDPNYVPLVQRAYELWRRLEHDADASLLHITGGLLLGSRNSAVVTGSLRSAEQHGIAHEFLDAGAIRKRYPAFAPSDSHCAVFELQAGYLRPEEAVLAHLKLASAAGADLRFEEPVVRWEATAQSGIRVTTGRGAYEADRLILSPGAWAADLIAELGVPLQVRRHAMCWFAPLQDFDLFAPHRFPVYVWETTPDRVFYGFPAIEGHEGGVKAAVHSGGDACTPATIDRNVTPEDVEEIRSYLSLHIPSLNGSLIKSSVCMYTLTPDEHFILSLHPKHPQVAVACGFSGHGFKFTSVVGEILADLSMNGTSSHPIEFLSPSRFTHH